MAEVVTTTTPPASQVSAYVAQVKNNILADLVAAQPGRGLRHTLLFESSLKLGSLQAAPWLKQEGRELMINLEEELFEAAIRNGYVDDYGEDDSWRTIENGMDMGVQRPFAEPVW